MAREHIVLVFVMSVFFNNVCGQSCPNGLYFSTNINDCVACPEQSIGCTEVLHTKTWENCMKCTFLHHDAKESKINVQALAITISVIAIAVILLVFVGVKYRQLFTIRQSTGGSNARDAENNIVHGDDHNNEDHSQDKERINYQIIENGNLLDKNNEDGCPTNEDHSQEKERFNFHTTEKGNLVTHENGQPDQSQSN